MAKKKQKRKVTGSHKEQVRTGFSIADPWLQKEWEIKQYNLILCLAAAVALVAITYRAASFVSLDHNFDLWGSVLTMNAPLVRRQSFLQYIKDINDWPNRPLENVTINEGPCNIDVMDLKDITQGYFLEKYAFQRPLVIRNYMHNKLFSLNCTMKSILHNFGYSKIVLSSANTNSYAKRKVSIIEYFTSCLSESQKVNQLGNETFYFFGDNNYTEWDPLFRLYKFPPFKLPNHTEALSFGIASAGTGVPFHFHGPGFAETIFGRKRWFLTPPEERPTFDGDTSSLNWFLQKYETAKNSSWTLLECTLGPSDLIYFPDKWWHATLNIDTSVFVSTFLSPH